MSENLAILQELTHNDLARSWFEQVLSYLRVRVASLIRATGMPSSSS